MRRGDKARQVAGSPSAVDRSIVAIGFLALAAAGGWLASIALSNEAKPAKLWEAGTGEAARVSVVVVLQLWDCQELLAELTELGEHHASEVLNVTGLVVDARDEADIEAALGEALPSFPLKAVRDMGLVAYVKAIGYSKTPFVLVFDEVGRLRVASPLAAGRSPPLNPIGAALALAADLEARSSGS